MNQKLHDDKEINKALKSAVQYGFEVLPVRKGHTACTVVAPNGQRLSVWSTPRDPGTMAKRIREFIRRHRM